MNSLGCPHPSLLLPSSPASTTCFIFFHSIFKDTSIGYSMDVLLLFREKKSWLTPWSVPHFLHIESHHFVCVTHTTWNWPASRDLRTFWPFFSPCFWHAATPSFCQNHNPQTEGEVPPLGWSKGGKRWILWGTCGAASWRVAHIIFQFGIGFFL